MTKKLSEMTPDELAAYRVKHPLKGKPVAAPASAATETTAPVAASVTETSSEPSATPPSAPVVSATAPAASSVTDASASTIKVTLAGAIQGSYEGPAGKSLKEMFPKELGSKTYQVRHAGKLTTQTAPWMVGSAELNVVEHAKHG